MKQLTEKNKKICAIVIIAIIIIAGIIVVATLGFNKELKYKQTQNIDVYIEQEFDINEIKDICNEVLEQKNIVEVVEIYQDLVTIRAESITEEQKDDIVNKIKEIYEFEQTTEDTEITTISATRIRDMYKKYILPIVISWIVITIYMVIRYYKKGIIKVIERMVVTPVIGELLLLSVMAIVRFPMGRFTAVLVIAIYIISILYVIKKNEK